MDPIKDAFVKVKEDMDSLKLEISFLRKDIDQTKRNLKEISEILENIVEKLSEIKNTKEKNTPTNPLLIQTSQTHIPTDNYSFKPLNPQNMSISTGNEGVPTDKQTDKQTDNIYSKQTIYAPNTLERKSNSIEDAVKIMDSLDTLKKEIRLKFKRLTDQEILVFSTIYQLEEEQGPIDYRAVALKLSLTESSIRDYVGRLIRKGIPVEKRKLNNKQILLSISPNLKKIATLPTILQLRDL